MKRMICFAATLMLLVSCGSKYPVAENAFDAGREFIDGCMKGDFDKASFYMMQDDSNKNLLDRFRTEYNEKSTQLKQEYKDASIIINQEETVSDSVHIIYYSNSYDKIANKVKVINSNGLWLVDFKYTFNGNL